MATDTRNAYKSISRKDFIINAGLLIGDKASDRRYEPISTSDSAGKSALKNADVAYVAVREIA